MGNLQRLEMRKVARGYNSDPQRFVERMIEERRARAGDAGVVVSGRLGIYLLPLPGTPAEIASSLEKYDSGFRKIHGAIKGAAISDGSGIIIQIVRPARFTEKYKGDIESGLYRICHPI